MARVAQLRCTVNDSLTGQEAGIYHSGVEAYYHLQEVCTARNRFRRPAYHKHCQSSAGSGGRSESLISFVRISIIVLSVILGIRAMGFADDLILLGFGLALGAAAVAAAIPFGLGGRKIAGELLARWSKTSSRSGKTDDKADK